MIVTEQTKISIEEYLALEEETGERHEYIGGEVRMMAGTTLEHEMIVKRLIRLLDECLETKGCTLVTGQMKMYTPLCDTAFLYPDIHIYCGEIKKKELPKGAYALVEPSLIIEVLSKGTRNYDRGDKFDCYRRMASLQGYVMVEGDVDNYEPAMYVRTWKGEDVFEEKTMKLKDTLDILGCSLSSEAVYGALQGI